MITIKEFMKQGKVAAMGIGIVTSLISVLVTLATVASFGWKMHREIISDVTRLQTENNTLLLNRISKSIDQKLDKQPSIYKINTNNELIKDTSKQVYRNSSRLERIEDKIDDLYNRGRKNGKLRITDK